MLSTSRPESTQGSTGWDTVHLLSEPTRRLVYETVRRADGPLSRDDVAARTGVNRRLVSFHLDRLADAGLLDVSFARPTGRTGPGAGRPAKQFTARDADVDITIPPRRYDLAARVLAEAVDTVGAGADVRAHALGVARAHGHRIGELRAPGGRMTSARSVALAITTLTDLGYEPERDASQVRLRNCPFDAVVDVAPTLVCEANLRLVDGILDGLGATELQARLVGPCDGCCVAVEIHEGVTAGR